MYRRTIQTICAIIIVFSTGLAPAAETAPIDEEKFVVSVCELFKGTARHSGCLKNKAPIIRYILKQAQASGIDPFTAAVVPFQESSYRSIHGDGGFACGIAQIHARWEPRKRDETVSQLCEKLVTDDKFSIRRMLRRLRSARDRDPMKRAVVTEIWRYKLPNGPRSEAQQQAIRSYERRHRKLRRIVVRAYNQE